MGAVEGAVERNQVEAVSPLFAEIHAQYGAAFDAALARNVADALAEDVGAGDQTGRLVPADDRIARFAVVCDQAAGRTRHQASPW